MDEDLNMVVEGIESRGLVEVEEVLAVRIPTNYLIPSTTDQ